MMSSKRKRLIETVENSPPVGTPAPKKRKGRISVKEKEKITEEVCSLKYVISSIRLVHYSFLLKNIPTRYFTQKIAFYVVKIISRADPEYYKQVKSPIDLTRIQQKLKTEEYRSFDEFCEDVELLVENSKSYYKVILQLLLVKSLDNMEVIVFFNVCRWFNQFSGKGSEIYRDAYALMQFFKEKRDQVLEKGVHPKRYFNSQFSCKCIFFFSYYPDYYDEIARPISLFMINKKLKRNDYQSFDQLFRDFMQVIFMMFHRNTCIYYFLCCRFFRFIFWLKTKLPQKEKRIRHSNGSAVPTSFNLANGYSYGILSIYYVSIVFNLLLVRLPEEQQRMWQVNNVLYAKHNYITVLDGFIYLGCSFITTCSSREKKKILTSKVDSKNLWEDVEKQKKMKHALDAEIERRESNDQEIEKQPILLFHNKCPTSGMKMEMLWSVGNGYIDRMRHFIWFDII
uniref:Bromo domain-containing protein n=1 Tax=Heterorhabditis bacteriophora TaxID=37862 RepID=A0A1I7WT51_HETBA